MAFGKLTISILNYLKQINLKNNTFTHYIKENKNTQLFDKKGNLLSNNCVFDLQLTT
jgi:hypothetical protein